MPVQALKNHPLRAAILNTLNQATDPMSPAELSQLLSRRKALKASLGNVSYHVKELASAGQIELVRTAPVRGALEHFYAPKVCVCSCCGGDGVKLEIERRHMAATA